MCNIIAAYLSFVQFILQLKLCLYTVVQLLLVEFSGISHLKVILKFTMITSHSKC